MDEWQEDVHRAAAGIRRRVLEHTVRNHGGYLSQACCSAEILATLYLKVMDLGPSEGPSVPAGFPGVPGPADSRTTGAAYNGAPDPDKDRFLLSPAHYALVLYAALIEAGRLAEEGLEHFNRDGSNVEMIGAEHSPGMEATTGSLGQALSVGIGRALARKRRGHRGRIWVMMSDGELQEGQTWEALQAAANFHLGNLGVYLDANGFQCDGPVGWVMEIEPIADKVRDFGWRVVEVDGHDVEALYQASLEKEPDRPLLVLCRTRPWEGIPSLKDRYPRFHYVRFRQGEAEAALSDLGLKDMAKEVAG
ncbi:MAG: thiamine pyrophosphate-dependent enzyme [Actinomycetota bacterium]|nr:thiamine pyrophosphate-dependent enzyme [Actinomycetota bacterium]